MLAPLFTSFFFSSFGIRFWKSSVLFKVSVSLVSLLMTHASTIVISFTTWLVRNHKMLLFLKIQGEVSYE